MFSPGITGQKIHSIQINMDRPNVWAEYACKVYFVISNETKQAPVLGRQTI